MLRRDEAEHTIEGEGTIADFVDHLDEGALRQVVTRAREAVSDRGELLPQNEADRVQW